MRALNLKRVHNTLKLNYKIIVNLANPQHLMQINPQLLVDGEAGALVKKIYPP